MNVSVEDQSNRTPLFSAIEGNQKAVCELLFECGSNINARDIKGMQPLFVAAQKGLKDIVQFLLSWHADIEARTHDGSSSLSVAKESGHKEIVELLTMQIEAKYRGLEEQRADAVRKKDAKWAEVNAVTNSVSQYDLGLYLKDFVVYQEGVDGFVAYFMLADKTGQMVPAFGDVTLTVKRRGVLETYKIKKHFVQSDFTRTARGVFDEKVLVYSFGRLTWHEVGQGDVFDHGVECTLGILVEGKGLFESAKRSIQVGLY